MRNQISLAFLLVGLLSVSSGYKNPNFISNHSVIVHLFEWTWKDIAEECERFLGPNKFGGVQVSPPNENLIIKDVEFIRPWYERYQPISYKLETRSGDEKAFADMSKRCNRAGVRIYVDAVINHMTADRGENQVGTGGSTADVENLLYPAVPYNKTSFNKPDCQVTDYNNVEEVRNCRLYGLNDLDQENTDTRAKIVGFLNKLIKLGVAGFHIDAAKHMWPADLKAIYERLDDLNTEFGFAKESRPFLFQEVVDFGKEAIKREEYTPMGMVTEFMVGQDIGDIFRGNKLLSSLAYWGPEFGFMEAGDSLVFVDNHDNQRGHGAGGESILTYKTPVEYRAAVAFLLAHPYGEPRIMSSFAFYNSEIGPPMDDDENILSPSINADGSCGNDWVCEHRWSPITQMVIFRSIADGAKLANWWDDKMNQIAFSRGNKAFIAFNNGPEDMSKSLNTGLPEGIYCDVITGSLSETACTGKIVTVDSAGKATIEISGQKGERMLAIHVGPASRALQSV